MKYRHKRLVLQWSPGRYLISWLKKVRFSKHENVSLYKILKIFLTNLMDDEILDQSEWSSIQFYPRHFSGSHFSVHNDSVYNDILSWRSIRRVSCSFWEIRSLQACLKLSRQPCTISSASSVEACFHWVSSFPFTCQRMG